MDIAAGFYWVGATICAFGIILWIGIGPGIAVAGFAIAVFPIIKTR